MKKYATIKRDGVYLYAFNIENTPFEFCSIQELDACLPLLLGEYCNYDINVHSELPIECVKQIEEKKEWFKQSLSQTKELRVIK